MIFSDDQINNILWGIAGLMMLGYWLFGNSADKDEEEEMVEYVDTDLCAEPELLAAKLKCLELANAMWRTPENTAITSDQIVADAKKFWDFLTEVPKETTGT